MDMNFVIFPPSATFHGVGYSERKQKKGTADLLHFDNLGHYQDGRTDISKKEFEDYLKKYSARNSRIKNAQFHAMLSCKGKQFSLGTLKDKAILIMERLGYAGVPILVYGHHDTKNNHVHVVTSRIGLDGGKINHNLEGVRANKILTDLLKLDTKEVFQQDIAKSLEYNFSTMPQFNMLMEIQGYTVKDNKEHFEYFKHGTSQGKTDIPLLSQKIKENGLKPKKPEQLRAILAKYAATHSTELKLNDALPYSTADRFFESDLINFLKEKFGYQFIFFVGRGQANPYGYAIIDNKNKTVYKGSEVYKLQDLICLSKNLNEVRKIHPTKGSQPNEIDLLNKNMKDIKDVGKVDQHENNLQQTTTSPKNTIDLISLLSIDDKIDSSAGQTPKRKKKRRNNFF